MLHLNDTTESYPVKLKTMKPPHYSIGVGIIIKDSRLLITKRDYKVMLGGLWEFPGGKVEQGETLKDSLSRELDEELGIQVCECSPFLSVWHEKDNNWTHIPKNENILINHAIINDVQRLGQFILFSTFLICFENSLDL